MLLAALLVLGLLVRAKMSSLQPRKKEKPEQPPGEQPVAPTAAKPPARPSPLAPSPGRAAAGEQEQIVVYNPSALRRSTLAKFVLGSFDDNSSDDELVAAAFRVGSRRSSLVGLGGTEPPTMTTLPEPTTGMRYEAQGRGAAEMPRLAQADALCGCSSRVPCCSNWGVGAPN